MKKKINCDKADIDCRNKETLIIEEENRVNLGEHPNMFPHLYPDLDDPNFNIKIAQKREFSESGYDGDIHNVKKRSEILRKANYEMTPSQEFTKNYMSSHTPYNSLFLYHGLGSGKTYEASLVCEDTRTRYKQMGVNKKIIVVASPNVQDNFKLQLFDNRKGNMKKVGGLWTTVGIGDTLIREVNPTNIKNLPESKITSAVNRLIQSHYSFYGYMQFANIIDNYTSDPALTSREKMQILRKNFGDTLIVIDEVHNIRASGTSTDKTIGKSLIQLVTAVPNIRLLLLSATPMFNSYKEIVWLINLMNINDRRGIVKVTDIFDSSGKFLKQGNREVGKELFTRKVTGYISYVRGENPYTFPFRVYPDRFSPEHTFTQKSEYPNYQLNGRKIPDNNKLTKLSLYLSPVHSHQEIGYKYIINNLRIKEAAKRFGYSELQLPIEALNIIYPYEKMEELKEHLNQFKEINNDDDDLDSDLDSDLDDGLEEIDLDDGLEEENAFFNDEVGVKKGDDDEDGEGEDGEGEDGEGEDEEEQMAEKPTRTIKIVVKKCKNGRIRDPKTNRCKLPLEPCPEGTMRNPLSNRCKKIIKIKPKHTRKTKTKECSEGKELNPITNRCNKTIKIKPTKECPEGTMRNPLTNRCKKTIKIKPKHTRKTKTKEFPEGKELNPIIISEEEEGIHISEGEEITGGESVFIEPAKLTGGAGLRSVMDFDDTLVPFVKGNFKYKTDAEHIFKPNAIGKYSSKIKSICESIYNTETSEVAKGIIFIYSSYIDGGLIPVALALEEMGVTRYGGNKKRKSFFENKPVPSVYANTFSANGEGKMAHYAMITGDMRISPDNDAEIRALTEDANKYGDNIKIVLVSQAGSEGIDFKNIRQLHIMEPWYNLNRIEQIIGRGVRNFSHANLPFEERNVQIFLHGSMLSEANEEAADLYVYRLAEKKATIIGHVTRLLKQTSVDCIVHHAQTKLTTLNMETNESNKNITQILSSGKKIDHFKVGDIPNTAICDYMSTCVYKCTPSVKSADITINDESYPDIHSMSNLEAIVLRIKQIMKERFFYTRKELLRNVNLSKKYPIFQIYGALTRMIDNNVDVLHDKYGRTGSLVNIGDYYLFQPSDITYPRISIYNRSVPVNYTNQSVRLVMDKEEQEEDVVVEHSDNLLDNLFIMYLVAKYGKKAQKASTTPESNIFNWYAQAHTMIDKLEKFLRGAQLDITVIYHALETLMMKERLLLMNYLLITPKPTLNNKISALNITNATEFNIFVNIIQKWIDNKTVVSKENNKGTIIFSGPSNNNKHWYILGDKTWVPATHEDIKEFDINVMVDKYMFPSDMKFNSTIGFTGFDQTNTGMVFKILEPSNPRNTGMKCENSGKKKTMKRLQNILEILAPVQNTFSLSEYNGVDLCIQEEILLRYLDSINYENKRWFIDTESEIMYNELKRLKYKQIKDHKIRSPPKSKNK